MVSGDPTNRRDETPFFSAESTTPGEADHVTDVLGPRNDCAGGADLLRESTVYQSEQPGPITEPRTSHMLSTERTRPDVLTTYSTNTTIANEPVLAGVQHGKGEDVKAGKPECPSKGCHAARAS